MRRCKLCKKIIWFFQFEWEGCHHKCWLDNLYKKLKRYWMEEYSKPTGCDYAKKEGK